MTDDRRNETHRTDTEIDEIKRASILGSSTSSNSSFSEPQNERPTTGRRSILKTVAVGIGGLIGISGRV